MFCPTRNVGSLGDGVSKASLFGNYSGKPPVKWMLLSGKWVEGQPLPFLTSSLGCRQWHTAVLLDNLPPYLQVWRFSLNTDQIRRKMGGVAKRAFEQLLTKCLKGVYVSLIGIVLAEGLPYKCQRCGRGYSVAYSLERHLRYECGVNRQFSCHICFKLFTRKDIMRVHIKKKHR